MSFRVVAPSLAPLVLLAGLLQTACHREGDATELYVQALTTTTLPASPTNAVADDPAAAALGQRLFFDKHLSVDGTIACVSCHDPAHGFSDPRAFSVGVRRQTGARHAMPVTTVAFQSFLLWDGRADSVWSQPIKAIENPKEMDLTRVELARVVAARYGEAYEAVFGALPTLDALPARGKPGMEAWDTMPTDVREDIDQVAANVGKALEAYERQLTCADTKFDRWTRGEASLTDREERGAEAFVEHHCNRCHSGPAFSDGKFHDIALPSSDPGRSVGRTQLLADEFNGAGLNSDDPIAGEAKLAKVSSETATEGAFRTASLRGVGQRTFFGHASHRSTLRGFIEDVYHGRHGGRDATVGRRDPLLRGVNVPHHELDELVAFLHTLDCPPVAPALLVH